MKPTPKCDHCGQLMKYYKYSSGVEGYICQCNQLSIHLSEEIGMIYLHDLELRFRERVPEIVKLLDAGQIEEIAKRGNRYISTCYTGTIMSWDGRLVLCSVVMPMKSAWLIQSIDLPDDEEIRAATFKAMKYTL